MSRIKGLRVTSDTIVRDFVAESDTITAHAMGKVIGATVVRTYLHDDEPIVEVTVEVPIESVISVIKELHTRTIQGDHVKGTDISNVTRSIKSRTFRATGMGIPPQRYLQAYNATVDAAPCFARGARIWHLFCKGGSAAHKCIAWPSC